MDHRRVTAAPADVAAYRRPLEPLPVAAGSCADRFPELLRARTVLDRLRVRHVELTRRFLAADEKDMRLAHFLMVGVMQRGYGLVEGLIDAVDSYNLAVAAPLVRLQIDTLVRAAYVAHAEDAAEVVHQISKGVPFRDMKGPDGRELSDAQLMRLAGPFHGWAAEVYEQTSGWVHLSLNHLRLASTVTDHSPGSASTFTASGGVPLRRDVVPATMWAELFRSMTRATEEIFKYIEYWEASRGLLRDMG